MIGLSAGLGSGGLTNSNTGETFTEDAFVGGFRVGNMLNPHILLHAEIDAWIRDDVIGVETEVQLSLWNFAIATTWFPGEPESALGGLWLRFGVGLSMTRVDQLGTGVLLSTSKGGWGWLIGAGYELRLTRSFALGVGVGYEAVRPDSDLFEDGSFIPMTVDLNWYF
jgi:hypothetical protein